MPYSMSHTFSLDHDQTTTHTWSIPYLWALSEPLSVSEWSVPDSFLSEWSWGKDTLADHILRVLSADLSYPILTYRGCVVDGNHRVIKALALGQTSLASKDFSELPPPSLVSPYAPDTHEGRGWTNADMLELVRCVLSGEVSLLNVVEV